MDKFFEILFLDETFEFLKNLDRKHYEKYYIIFVNLSQNITQNFLKNLRTILGNLEHSIRGFNIDYWPFGIRLQQKLPWWFQHMDLLKKEQSSRP